MSENAMCLETKGLTLHSCTDQNYDQIHLLAHVRIMDFYSYNNFFHYVLRCYEIC